MNAKWKDLTLIFPFFNCPKNTLQMRNRNSSLLYTQILKASRKYKGA